VTVFFIVVIGTLADFVFSYFQLIKFDAYGGVPLWLICLWCWFAVTFFDCYKWMNKLNLLLVSAIGAIFGPIAYWGASFLSEVEILAPISFSIFSGIFWGLLFFLIIKADRHFSSVNRLKRELAA